MLTSFSFSQSTFIYIYLFLHLPDLLLQSLILLLRLFVVPLQLAAVDLSAASQHALEVIHRISWLFRLFVELHEDLGQLVDRPSLLEVLLELVLLRFNASLRIRIATCDILILSFIKHLRSLN
jgi:hypothetical protein